MTKVIVSLILCFSGLLSNVQANSTFRTLNRDTGSIIVLNIGISYLKTTLIIFPYSVLPVDIGSEEVLAQKVEGVANALKVKAGVRCFQPTNLTAVTSDGKAYSINLFYDEDPYSHLIDLRQEVENKTVTVDFIDGQLNEKYLNDCLDSVSVKEDYLHSPKVKSEQLQLSLSALYYQRGIMYVKVKIENNSKLPFEIDFTRSSIKDAKKIKRTAIQSTEIKPVVLRNEHNLIHPGESNTLIFAYTQFSILQNQRFHLEIFEKNGSRNLSIAIKSRKLLQVKAL